jgi:hypothetical protein
VAELQTNNWAGKAKGEKIIQFVLVYYVCCLAAVTGKFENTQIFIMFSKNGSN